MRYLSRRMRSLALFSGLLGLVFSLACASREYVPTRQIVKSDKAQRDFFNVPQGARNRHNLGMRCFQRGDYPCAARHWREALKAAIRYPEFQYEVNYNLGCVFQEMGKNILAERHFRMAIALEAGDAKARAGLGASLVAQGRYTDAGKTFQEALAYDPDLPEAYLGVADLHMRHNRYMEAADALWSTRNLDAGRKGVDEALRMVCVALAAEEMGRNNLDRAEELYAVARRLDPSAPRPYFGLGHVMIRRGYPGRAMAYYRQGREKNPDFKPTSQDILGHELAQGDFLVQAVRASTLADYYIERQDYERAAEQLDLVLTLDPMKVDSWLTLGEMNLNELERPEKAADCLHALWMMGVQGQRVEHLALKFGQNSPPLPKPAPPTLISAGAGLGQSPDGRTLNDAAAVFDAGKRIFRQAVIGGMFGSHEIEKRLINPQGKTVGSEVFELDCVVDRMTFTSADTLGRKGEWRQDWLVDGKLVGSLKFDLR